MDTCLKNAIDDLLKTSSVHLKDKLCNVKMDVGHNLHSIRAI